MCLSTPVIKKSIYDLKEKLYTNVSIDIFCARVCLIFVQAQRDPAGRLLQLPLISDEARCTVLYSSSITIPTKYYSEYL
jgi:hypothetical protein